MPPKPEPQKSVGGSKLLQQVSGHSNAFMKVSDTEIWKLTDAPERDMLITLMGSPEMCELVPAYTRDVPLEHWEGRDPGEDSVCVQLQDLTAGFGDRPSVMDIKLGTRTFLEDEVKNPKVRADLLGKMDKLDPKAATEAEREAGGITKLRYMQFREQTSTSSTLGFRLEGLTVADRVPTTNGATNGAADVAHVQLDVPSKDTLSKISTEEAIVEQLRAFLRSDAALKELYLQRLRTLHATLSSCSVFAQHQFINSSLLFVHDVARQRCGVWMIDFSKARPAKAPLTHTATWELGNQEDGYLFGLSNLIRVWEAL